MAEQPSGERTEDATPKRRQDARKKGTVAKSTDLVGAVGLLVVTLAVPGMVRSLSDNSLDIIRNTVSQAPTDVTPHSMMSYGLAVAAPLFFAAAPLLFAILVVGVATNFAQVGFVLSAETLKPTFQKINPLNGFKRIFSRKGAVEGAKAVAKLGIFSYIVYTSVQSEWPRLITMGHMTPFDAAVVLGQTLHGILVKIAVVWLLIAVADYVFQRFDTEKQLKMTKDELKREMKEQEGSPELKMAIAQRRRKILKGGMAAKLKEADVLVTNPTHFAIAIKYERNSMHAPVVVAKGQDFLALKMREIAAQLDLPIVENKPLARALYKQCEPGDFVPRDLFMGVAEVLAYVYKSTQKAKRAS